MIQSYLDVHPTGELFSAPFDVVLSFTDIVVPDLIYLSKARAHLLTAKNLQGAPDLVVEILSPSTRPRDERLKRDLYERMGVEEYWLVDPEQESVTIYRRGGGQASGRRSTSRSAASSRHRSCPVSSFRSTASCPVSDVRLKPDGTRRRYGRRRRAASIAWSSVATVPSICCS